MRLVRLLCAGLGLALPASPAWTAKLDKPICDDLKVELSLLQQKGVAADLAKGAAWGKANLSRDRLKEIERWLHVEEQLAFRCPLPKRPLAPGEDEDGNSAAAPAKGTKAALAKPPAVKPKAPSDAGAAETAPPATAKKPVKAPAAAAAPAVPAPSQEASAGPATKKTAAKPKPKDDAYTPPAAATEGSPFRAY